MSAGPYSIGSNVWPGTSKLTEEMGELHQVLGKLIGLGGVENFDHWDGTNIRDKLHEELADVLAAVSFFIDMNDLDWGRIVERQNAKGDLFRRWHREQT